MPLEEDVNYGCEWKIYGKYMEHGWKTYGKYYVNGKYMEMSCGCFLEVEANLLSRGIFRA